MKIGQSLDRGRLPKVNSATCML